MNNQTLQPTMTLEQKLTYLTEGGSVEQILEVFELVKATAGIPRAASIFKICSMQESSFQKALEILITLGVVKRGKNRLTKDRIYFSLDASKDESDLKEKMLQLLASLTENEEENTGLRNIEEIRAKKINKGRIRKQREEVSRKREASLIVNHIHLCRDYLNKTWWYSQVGSEQAFGRLCREVLCKVGKGDFWTPFFQCFRLEASEYYRDVEKEDCWFCYEEAARAITEIAENLENHEDFKEKLCIQLFKKALVDDMEGTKSYLTPVMRLV